MRKTDVLHELALAQQDIDVLEKEFCKIIGPDLVHYYCRAHCQGEDISGPALGKL